MTIHDITRLIVLLADKSTAQEFSWAVLLFMTIECSQSVHSIVQMAKKLPARTGICKKSGWVGKAQGNSCLRMKRAG